MTSFGSPLNPPFDCRVEILNAVIDFQYQIPHQLTASLVFREPLFAYAKAPFIKPVGCAKRHQCLHRFASQGNTVLVTLEGYRATKTQTIIKSMDLGEQQDEGVRTNSWR